MNDKDVEFEDGDIVEVLSDSIDLFEKGQRGVIHGKHFGGEDVYVGVTSLDGTRRSQDGWFTSHFKPVEPQVGDRVRWVTDCAGLRGGVGTIRDISWPDYYFKEGGCCTYPIEHFRVIQGPNKPPAPFNDSFEVEVEGTIEKDIMTTLAKHIKELRSVPMSAAKNLITSKLTADERYLRKNGLKNADGTPTGDGINVMDQFLFDRYEGDLVAALRAADKAIRAAQKADDSEMEVEPE